MKTLMRVHNQWRWEAWAWGIGLMLMGGSVCAQPSAPNRTNVPVRVLAVKGPGGAVEIRRAGAVDWDWARTNQVLRPGDMVRTKEEGWVTLRWTDNSTVRLRPMSHLLVEPARDERSSGFNLLRGLLYFFHRDKPTEARFKTRLAAAAIRGTEFVLEFDEATSRTVLTVLDGMVEFNATESSDSLHLVSGEQGVIEPGQPPRKTAVINTINVVQWCLYYPAVLEVEELGLAVGTQSELAASLQAYQAGDLPKALAAYPTGRKAASPEETVYAAALQLAVGNVAPAERLLQPLWANPAPTDRAHQLAAALRTLIAAVKLEPRPAELAPRPSPLAPDAFLASEWLAESYYLQSRTELPAARAAARQAVAQSPRFGLGWARLAEMEFSFGDLKQTRAALERALEHAPRNAQAIALQGFILAAENRIPAALRMFDQAIAADGGLGNGWLGRGLCRIRQGDEQAGKDDLQVAVTVEPQRALLRSYLGKAWSVAGNNRQARQELELARKADPKDPTSWLYLALLNQQDNRINEAVRDLERSQALNDNRQVYRSRLLLDQDRAVRSANLASIYRDAGMADWSLREAGQAVSADYANYSAHAFLGSSYNELRGHGRTDLRLETPAVSEYLVANLLSDARAGTLSPYLSQQEYGKLFDRDRVGFASSTEYLSRGAWTQTAVQYGILGNSSYAAEMLYGTDPGQRVNHDLEQVSLSLKFKHQLTPTDVVYFQGLYAAIESGDLTPNYWNAANPHLRVKETQEPILLAGYRHQWSPGSHTLFLGGRLQDLLRVTDADNHVLLQVKNAPGQVIGLPAERQGAETLFPVFPRSALSYQSEFEAYTAEVQQLWQSGGSDGGGAHTLIAGARFQAGTLDTRYALDPFAVTGVANQRQTNAGFFLGYPQAADRHETDLLRLSGYAYYHWHVAQPLLATAGVSYDWLDYPQNHRLAPTANAQENRSLWSPKAGLVWTPLRHTTLRAAYARALGGVSFDQSFQLEPTQVGGFNQAYRSLIPESVAGSIPAAEHESWNLALEQTFRTGTHLGAHWQYLTAEAERTWGAFDVWNTGAASLRTAVPFGSREALDYQEWTLLLTANQLLGRHWSLGARYRLSEAELQRTMLDIPPAVSATFHFRDEEATMHQVNLYGLFHHPCGAFGSFESLWTQQSNRGYTPDIPGDDFWQLNATVGYRFARRHAELRLGLLNLTDQDYRLNPLNLTAELPRHRTLAMSCRFWF